jgi:hypothetical protein
MSSLTKVIIKRGEDKYQWSQTDESIVIYLPIKNVTLKNIDVFYSDLVLKVNCQSIKYIAILDFLHPIDYLSSKNKFQLLDGRLEVFLIKN